MALRLILHTFRMIFGNLGQALKISIGPYIMMMIGFFVIFAAISPTIDATTGVSPLVGLLGFLLFPLVLFVAAWIAVSWHRFILLEEYTSVLPRVTGRPIWSYAGKAILLGLLLAGIFLPIFWIFSSIILIRSSQNFGFAPAIFFLLYFAVILLFSGAAMRLGVALVGTAVGKPMRFRDAWSATSTVSFVVLGVAAILIIFQLVGNVVLAVLAFQLPFDLMKPVAVVLNVVLTWTTMMLCISILTTIYGHVVEGRSLVD